MDLQSFDSLRAPDKVQAILRRLRRRQKARYKPFRSPRTAILALRPSKACRARFSKQRLNWLRFG